MTLIEKLIKLLFAPASKFHIGDCVQFIEGDRLMIVIEILSEPKMKQPLINCKWQEPENEDIRTQLFLEKNLKPLDWNKPGT